MSRILIIREEKAEIVHLERLLKKREVWNMFEKPWLSGLDSKCRKLKTRPEK